MSQIPRLHSSPTQPPPTLKRKNLPDSSDDEEDHNDNDNDSGNRDKADLASSNHRGPGPRKVPALGGVNASKPSQPLRNVTTNNINKTTTRGTRSASVNVGSGGVGAAAKKPASTGAGGGGGVTRGGSNANLATKPKPLTRPRQPNLSTATTTRARARGTSAPPSTTSASSSSRPVTRSTATTTAAGRGAGTRGVGATLPPIDEKWCLELQQQVTSLQNQHLTLSSQFQFQQTVLPTSTTNVGSGLSSNSALPDEIASLQRKHRKELSDLESELRTKERLIRELTEDLRLSRSDLSHERSTSSSLKQALSSQSTAHISLEAQNTAFKAQISVYQSQISDTQSELGEVRFALGEKDREIKKLEEEARENERVRRRLHNKVQELKGNIRVFARVRPALPNEAERAESEEEEVEAKIVFPDKSDHREIVVHSSSESAMGNERMEMYNFSFDRVFEPTSTQEEVFDEISQLAQSCTDGYNVCIFAYGQTGSGKSFTMEGGSTPDTQGMIPRAVDQVFRETQELRSKGWEYTIEGQFLEIYNETITDLLSSTTTSASLSNSSNPPAPLKHEIKHDPKTHTTTVTSLTTHTLTSASQVRSLLTLANSRRRTASTIMNERSSRSHSVFTLRIAGVNKGSGERCRGCLNLVDLAGSERLVVSREGGEERMRETKAINKSLSALGDVIAALGERGQVGGGGGKEGGKEGEGHVPYRNSKLTYLLQYSLSGSSKTLMVLNLSPLAAHLNESLNSLRFATKVNNTTIGTARKQIR